MFAFKFVSFLSVTRCDKQMCFFIVVPVFRNSSKCQDSFVNDFMRDAKGFSSLLLHFSITHHQALTMVTISTSSEQEAVECTPLLAGSESNRSNALNKNATRKKVSFHGECLDSNLSVDDNMNSDLFAASWRDTDTSTRSDAGAGFFSTTVTPNNSLRSSISSSISRSFLNRYTQSNSQRERALAREGVGAAAFLIRDAVLGEMESHDPAHGVYDPYQHPERKLRNNISIASRRLTSYRPLLHFMRFVTWTLVLLTFIEPPAWCRQKGINDDHTTLAGCPAYFAAEGIPASNSNSTDTKSVSYYPSSGALFITGTQSIRIEAVCLAFMSLFLLLHLGRDGMSLKRYFRAGHSGVNRTVQFVSLILLTVGLLADYRPHHPVTRLVLLATILPGCRRDLQILIHMLPEITNVLALLTIMITFYAWFGTVMFVDTVEGSQHFSSLVESMWTLVCTYTLCTNAYMHCVGCTISLSLHLYAKLTQSYCLATLQTTIVHLRYDCQL
jgi:hypothetical protein